MVYNNTSMALGLRFTKIRDFCPLVLIGIVLIAVAHAQEEFQGPIECYTCYDKAINTTCGEPMGPEDTKTFNTIICKRGACVKWTYYRDNVLMIERTCSEKVTMHIPLNTVCRTERNGNGYLCMCAKDHCNSAPGATRGTSGLRQLLTLSATSALLHLFSSYS